MLSLQPLVFLWLSHTSSIGPYASVKITDTFIDFCRSRTAENPHRRRKLHV